MSNMIHIVSIPEHQLAIRDGKSHAESLRISAKFLPNPFKVKEFQLQGLTGLDKEVSSWIEEEYEKLTGRPIGNMIHEKFELIKWRILNSNSRVYRIYIYCIGGLHRSPYMAEKLRVHILSQSQLPIKEVRTNHAGLSVLTKEEHSCT